MGEAISQSRPREGSKPLVADPDRAPIFVVGTGRSGTTLLRVILNAHPRIYLTHEASFYFGMFGFKARDPLRDWFRYYQRSPAFAWLRLDPREVEAALPKGAKCSRIADGYRAIMRCKAARYGRVRYGDKTPLHSVYLWKIFRDFPDPRVIHVVRDPRGAVASLLRMPWAASSRWLNSLYCDQQLKAVSYFAKRIHEVRLEDLIESPEPCLRSILDFLGEPWDDAVLDHAKHAPLDDMPPFPWFQDARRPLKRSTRSPEWHTALSPAWIRIVESMNRFAFRRYGYQVHPLDREPGVGARFAARVRDLPRAARSLLRLRRMARLYQHRRVPDPQKGMETLLQVNPEAWKAYPDFVMPTIPRPD